MEKKFYNAVLEIASGIFSSVEEMKDNCLWVEVSKDKGFGVKVTDDAVSDKFRNIRFFRRKQITESTFVELREKGEELLGVLPERFTFMKEHFKEVEELYKVGLGITYAYDKDDLPCVRVDLYSFGASTELSCHPRGDVWDYITVSYYRGCQNLSIKKEREILMWIEGSSVGYQKHVITLKAEMEGLKTSIGKERIDVELPEKKWEFKWNELPKDWEFLTDTKEDVKFSKSLR